MRKITIPITVTWKIKCHCGRQFTLRKGQTHRCVCGHVWRG